MTATERTGVELRRLISDEGFRSGDRLPPERALATALAVSRPTVREAIRQLTEAGLLEAHLGSGTFVAAIDLAGLFEVRMRLEPLAAELTAARRSADEVTRLCALECELEATVADPQPFAMVDLHIHLAIAAASHNRYLDDAISRMTEQTMISRNLTSPRQEVRLSTLAEMKKVIGAIAAQDASRAARHMERHLILIREAAALDTRG